MVRAPVVGAEPVLLLDRNPGQLTAPARQVVRHPSLLVLALNQLVTSRPTTLGSVIASRLLEVTGVVGGGLAAVS